MRFPVGVFNQRTAVLPSTHLVKKQARGEIFSAARLSLYLHQAFLLMMVDVQFPPQPCLGLVNTPEPPFAGWMDGFVKK